MRIFFRIVCSEPAFQDAFSPADTRYRQHKPHPRIFQQLASTIILVHFEIGVFARLFLHDPVKFLPSQANLVDKVPDIHFQLGRVPIRRPGQLGQCVLPRKLSGNDQAGEMRPALVAMEFLWKDVILVKLGETGFQVFPAVLFKPAIRMQDFDRLKFIVINQVQR